MHQEVGVLRELAWGKGRFSVILDTDYFPRLFSSGEVMNANEAQAGPGGSCSVPSCHNLLCEPGKVN